MRTLFLGIDALDRLLLDRFQDHMPNLVNFCKKAKTLPVISTFPPDSDTAWATISTGYNPAQHGIVRFIDPLEKSYQILNKGIDNGFLQGKTFWDITAEAGYKTAAIFPHLGYPIWSTKASVVARGSNKVDVQTNRPDLLTLYPNQDSLLGVRGFPERKVAGMLAYYEKLSIQAVSDAEFALRVMQREDWDLFFIYWSTIDAIGHFFWNYFDRNDPGFSEGHPLQNIILETYKLYDQIIGRFLSAASEATNIVILSDHGHGARPFNLVNINEVPRHSGFLSARSIKSHPHIGVYEKAKRLAVTLISRYGFAKLAGRVMRNFPGAVQSFTRPSSINWNKTIAYATDMSGIKAYPYGGIIINREALDGKDYEQVRTEIIQGIQKKCVLLDGTSLVEFICRREDLYNGPFLNRYPDIVLCFKYGYGVGWAINEPLLTKAASYNLVPGSHRGETGTFMIKTMKNVKADSIDLLDVTPSIPDLLDISRQQKYDGKTIFK